MDAFTRDALADPRQLSRRFLEEWLDALPRESLEALAGFRFSDELQDAADEFAGRAGGGELSREQREAYEDYLRTADLASLLRMGAMRRAGLLNPGQSRPRTVADAPAGAATPATTQTAGAA